MTNTEWDILDKNSLGTIQLCLVASIMFNISKETTTEGLMSELAKLYENSSPQIRYFLRSIYLI